MQPTKRLLVQDYLLNHTFGELEREHGVAVSVAKANPYKFSINYDQIASKPSPLVNECRGVILRTTKDLGETELPRLPLDSKALSEVCVGETSVLARPFDRFFNLGDPNCATVDWEDSELAVQEKLDGTLAIVYHDTVKNAWCMATRSVADADFPFETPTGPMTFRQLFDVALQKTTGLNDLSEFMWDVDEELTFCFELTSRLNRIVVDYREEGLTWLGTRNRRTGQEYTHLQTVQMLPRDLVDYFPRPAKVWPLRTVQEVLEAVAGRSALESEGVVVVDSHFRRVKIKSLNWLAANRIKTNCSSQRAMWGLILDDKIDDAIPFLPDDIAARIPRMQNGVAKLCFTLDDTVRDILAAYDGSQKDYALRVQKTGLWATPMYVMKAKGVTARQWLASQRNPIHGYTDSFLDTVMEIIGDV